MNTWTFAMIWVFAWAIAGGLMMVAVDALVAQGRRRKLMAAGLYPRPGTETDEDVQRLMAAGQVDMAIRCHRSVHHVSYQLAKEQLVGTKTPEYGFVPAGFILGIALGFALKSTAVGVGLGLMLGAAFGALARKRRDPHDRLR